MIGSWGPGNDKSKNPGRQVVGPWPGPTGRPLGQWSFLQIFCAGAQRSKLVFANGLPITLGMNEATSANTTRVTLATATRGRGIKMAIYCPQGRDFHTRAQRKMVTKKMVPSGHHGAINLYWADVRRSQGRIVEALITAAMQWWDLTMKEKITKY